MGKKLRNRWPDRTRQTSEMTLGDAERLTRTVSARIQVAGDHLHRRTPALGPQVIRDNEERDNCGPSVMLSREDVALIEWNFFHRVASDAESQAEVTMLELVKGEAVDATSQPRPVRLVGGWRRLWSDIA